NSRISVLKYDSVTVGINKAKESNLSVYPNPANDNITIEIPEGQTPCQLSMMNLDGEVVLMYSLIRSKTQIDISTLRGGVYFMRLTTKFKVCIEKFVKQ
ncbi:MAG: T9SS type A sorting domain-containing protein, partial [Bacteroidota bacterium]